MIAREHKYRTEESGQGVEGNGRSYRPVTSPRFRLSLVLGQDVGKSEEDRSLSSRARWVGSWKCKRERDEEVDAA